MENRFLILTIQTLLLILFAPALSGLIRKFKNNLRMRKGAPVLQPYYNLSKLFQKEEVVSENSSWILKATPHIVLGTSVTALLLLPAVVGGIALSSAGDIIALLFILALGRFFLSLAGLDTASAFGGMGSSREMFLSSLAEPVAVVAVLAVALNTGSTNLNIISGTIVLRFSSAIALIALFLVAIVETSRLPVDNQETHLELTMIHEAMVLEYSGRSLAMIELASHVKQILFFSLLSCIFIPYTIPSALNGMQLAAGISIYAGKLLVFAAVMALLEVSVAKMRLFRAVDFLAFSLLLSITAVIASIAGF